MALGDRPAPPRYPEDTAFLDGAARGELLLPHCRRCGEEFWPAGPVCPRDGSPDVDRVRDPGDGAVSSWVRFHKRYYRDEHVPYVVVQVVLDTGPRLTTTWAGEAEPASGQRVGVTFRALPDGTVLPEFGPAVTGAPPDPERA